MKNLFLLLPFLAATALADDIIKRGEAIPADAKAIPLTTVLENPAEYTKKTVVVEGVIAKACTNKGCWMELVPEAGKAGVRVTFKDYGFFVPLDSKGLKARAEGVTAMKTLTKERADHLESEGAAKFTRNADGTVSEVSFVAQGVELRKP